MKPSELMIVALSVLLVQIIAVVTLTAGNESVGAASVTVAATVMVLVGLGVGGVLLILTKRYATERSVKLAMMALGQDEQKVMKAIMELDGEVWQYKLVQKLGFSKPKLSALVKNLERKKAISCERHGRTNLLRVSEDWKR